MNQRKQFERLTLSNAQIVYAGSLNMRDSSCASMGYVLYLAGESGTE